MPAGYRERFKLLGSRSNCGSLRYSPDFQMEMSKGTNLTSRGEP